MSEAATTELEVLDTSWEQTDEGAASVLVTLRVPPELLYFSGHFPDDPLLPGVVQISKGALVHVERLWPDLGRLENIKRLKFIHAIRPGDVIRLRLARRTTPGQIAWTILRDEDTICTSGLLRFSLEESS